jgi:hypothetical protein
LSKKMEMEDKRFSVNEKEAEQMNDLLDKMRD